MEDSDLPVVDHCAQGGVIQILHEIDSVAEFNLRHGLSYLAQTLTGLDVKIEPARTHRRPTVNASALDLKTRYERDGFVSPVPVMSREEAAGLRAALETAEAQTADRDERSLLYGYANMVVPEMDALIRDARILDPVSALLGPDLLLWGANFFIKEPGTGDYVSWHQDLNYWGLNGEHEVTAWVALSDATVRSGAMRFIPGSHRTRVEHEDTFAKGNLLSRGQEIAVDVDEDAALDIVLEAGEMSLHHGLMFHSSAPNRSTDRRIGLALRYISPEMQQVAGSRDYAQLVRGADRYEHFESTARPTGVLDPADLERARQVRADKEQFLYRGVPDRESVTAQRRR